MRGGCVFLFAAAYTALGMSSSNTMPRPNQLIQFIGEFLFYGLKQAHHPLRAEYHAAGGQCHRQQSRAAVSQKHSRGEAHGGGKHAARALKDGGHRHYGQHGVRNIEQKAFDKTAAQLFAQQRQRQQQVYQQCPELEGIQREIRGTMGEIIASALRRGTDPLPAIRVIRDKNLSLQKRRAELLAQLGYPEDYLSEKPRCPLCGDTGYRGDGLCSCLKKYYAQEQIRELSRMLDIGSQSFDTFELDWYSPDRGSLPRSPRENAQRNLNLCRDFAARFRPGRENLLLFGAPGLGKTFLSACIARVVSEDGFSVVYDTAGHVFSQFESAKFRRDDDGDTAGEDVERCMNCDLLILDDLGTEMTTSFVQSALYQLLNGRLLTGRSTVISTNLDPEELGRRYGAPLLSRLEGEYQLLPFVGTDIRRLKREQG